MRRLVFSLIVFLLLGGCADSPAAAPARNSNGTRRLFPPGPPELPGQMVVLAYEDFGPQSMAGSLLGDQCYRFGACCCAEIDDTFDIRVVVHAGVTEDAVRARYPTRPDVGDFRPLEAGVAKAFIAARLVEMDSWEPADRIVALEETLRRTQDRLSAAFPD